MNALDVLKYGHLTVLHTIEGLPESEWETGGVCGVWSVKDIIGHLGAFELMLVDIMGSFLGNVETPYLDKHLELGPGRFNDFEADRRKEWSAAAVMDEYQQAYERVMALAAQLPAAIWSKTGTLAWYGSEYDLEDFIAYTYYGHKREHSAQIAVYRDTLDGKGLYVKREK
ncbi:MAG: DinB family protein [Chloroflexota bacterium]